jgi:hypothetical protein
LRGIIVICISPLPVHLIIDSSTVRYDPGFQLACQCWQHSSRSLMAC